MLEVQSAVTSAAKQNVVNLIFLLSVFPFLRIIPLGSSETQPIACVVAAIHLLLLRKHTFPKQTLLPYLFVLGSYFFIGLIGYIANPSESFFLPAGLESIVILFAPLLIFVALYENLHLLKVQVVKLCIYAWAGISILQAFLPSILNATGISFILSRLISRFSSAALGGTRGVAGFAPEPSYAAQVIILLLAICLFLYRKQRLAKQEFVLMLASCVSMIVLNRSATIASFIAVFVFGFLMKTLISYSIGSVRTRFSTDQGLRVSKKILLLMCALVPVLISLQVFSVSLPESRVTDLVVALSNLNADNFNLIDILGLTNDLGSQRTLSVYSGYYNIVETRGLGSGLGSWSVNFLDTLEQAGIDASKVKFFVYNGFKNLKPYAYAALVSFDMGCIGLFTLSSMFLSLLLKKIMKVGMPSAFACACLICGSMMLYFNSLASLPTGWILILIGLQDMSPRTQGES
ncbi:hypothetical protein IQ266_12750 [filamentous cyanobacterium LEGE 11480]|uniref:Uncharacterized protein n=1 Tax=Romeriopsis navalis LEGE 11480 TaxID=2777977 RepID=A0A928VLM8_9CYAN|nr:hypothetical protein [Romeriopsis navalis]MBE9030600.1 hypothetical protein [Romeriopsis navalis LEGE 11480]